MADITVPLLQGEVEALGVQGHPCLPDARALSCPAIHKLLLWHLAEKLAFSLVSLEFAS